MVIVRTDKSGKVIFSVAEAFEVFDAAIKLDLRGPG